MTKIQLNKYQRMLEQKQLELDQRPDRQAIAIERSADVLDEIQNAGERELVIRNLDRETELLRMVRSALDRIQTKEFGVCLECEEDINPKRLNALPWAERCVQCQERVDQEQPSAEEAA